MYNNLSASNSEKQIEVCSISVLEDILHEIEGMLEHIEKSANDNFAWCLSADSSEIEFDLFNSECESNKTDCPHKCLVDTAPIIDSGIFVNDSDLCTEFRCCRIDRKLEAVRLSQSKSFVDLKSLSESELFDMEIELRAAVRNASDLLVKILHKRDNYKTSIDVYKDFFELTSSFQMERNFSTAREGRSHINMLFTTIPYDSSTLSVQSFLLLNSVIRSLLSKQENFPSVLTEYILKLLRATPQ